MASLKAFNIIREAASAVIPAGALTVSEWADKHRVLSAEAAAEPGKWRTSRVPYSREWMDTINDPLVHTVVLKTSSQVAKSETLNNVCGYFMHHDPCPILMIQPTVDRMKDYSKKRIGPMIRDTPELRAVTADEKARDSDNTMLSKSFIGGHLLMVGANAASALASNPIRLVLADEVDRYPRDVDNEGDPLTLAMVRQTTFTNRKTIITSTPTIRGESRIEQEYERSNKNQCFLPCPHCGHKQTLRWRDEEGTYRLRWEQAETGEITEVYYICDYGCIIEPRHKLWMIDRYEWRPQKEQHNGIVGFEINALYSPWLGWKEIAERFIKASDENKKGNPETLKTFVNTTLGETWDTKNEQADVVGLEKRTEPYATDVPLGVLLLTAGIDTQPNRLECSIWGWGLDNECWLIYHQILWGDTSKQTVWQELKELLTEEFECERETDNGVRLRRTIDVACIDAGGHNAEDVKQFTNANRGRKWLAIFSRATGAKETITQRPTRTQGGATLWAVGPNLIKDKIFAQLKVTERGPGYVHFPIDDTVDAEYFKQLTSEKRVRKQKKFDSKDPYGYSQWMYKKIRERNEALDCFVYAFAAKDHLRPNFQRLLEKEVLHCKTRPVTLSDSNDASKASYAGKFKSQGGFVSRFKRGS